MCKPTVVLHKNPYYFYSPRIFKIFMGVEKLKVTKYQQVQNQKCWKGFFVSISVPRKYPRNGKATLLDISCSWSYDPKYQKNVAQANFLSKVFQSSRQSQQVVVF